MNQWWKPVCSCRCHGDPLAVTSGVKCCFCGGSFPVSVGAAPLFYAGLLGEGWGDGRDVRRVQRSAGENVTGEAADEKNSLDFSAFVALLIQLRLSNKSSS